MATAKQKIFISEYLKTWNATHAARVAGYASPNTAGNRLLLNDGIREILDAELEARMLSADQVLMQLSEMALGLDLTMYFNKEKVYGIDSNGEKYLKGIKIDFDFEKLQEDGKSSLIKSVKVDKSNNIQIEFFDRLGALEKLGRYHKLFTQKVDVTTDGQPLGEAMIAAIDQVYGSEDDRTD